MNVCMEVDGVGCHLTKLLVTQNTTHAPPNDPSIICEYMAHNPKGGRSFQQPWGVNGNTSKRTQFYDWNKMVPMTVRGILHKLNFNTWNTWNTWVICRYCTLYAVSLHSIIRLNKTKVSLAALPTVLFYSSEKIFNLCTRCIIIKAKKNEPKRKKNERKMCVQRRVWVLPHFLCARLGSILKT